MISFTCTHCGGKFQVKPDRASRPACPTCGNALVVPDGGTAERLDLTATNPLSAGICDGMTLTEAGGLPSSGQRSVELLTRRSGNRERYVVEDEIARGGMGAVLRVVDCNIRREVAVKYLLDQGDASKRLRFVEEAQVTGQLEHPNIVPIHELGRDAQGRVFFTMKMVKGRSLADVLHSRTGPLRRSDERTPDTGEFPLSRLLTVMVNVCHALAYAHSRGVIHRDLKPANIMVGDFGEVYVMDWGLAKILRDTPPAGAGAIKAGTLPAGERPRATVMVDPALAPAATRATLSLGSEPASPLAPVGAPSATRSGPDVRIITDRLLPEDLTQDGAVLGTPVYMPPEQASGQIEAIDQRSDVYALGAILYEILTSLPPVLTEGGTLAILDRVVNGAIVPPQTRLRQAGSKQQIAPELAAVALKALAKDPRQRYATAASLREDIERYLEGRSVSAKEDSRREMLIKLVKRNKGLSAGIAAAFVVLAVSLVLIGRAWLETNQAYANALEEQETKNRKGRELVPAFVRAARLMTSEKRFDDALAQVEVALRFDADDADARLLRAQLWISAQRYADAAEDLRDLLKHHPGSEQAGKLAELCREATGNKSKVPDLAEELARQNVLTLAIRLTQQAGVATAQQGNPLVSQKLLLAQYRKRLDETWPDGGQRLTLDGAGKLVLNLSGLGNKVRSLEPLQGLPLTALDLSGCASLRDLYPLQGMPLTRLTLNGCGNVRDLTPLHGMKLEWLHMWQCGGVKNLEPLRGMPLTSLQLDSCRQVTDLTPLAAMKLTWLSLRNCQRVQDISLLQGMPLQSLNLGWSAQIRSVAPVKGMPLTELALPQCTTDDDLKLLAGMPLSSLDLGSCAKVLDLKRIAGFKLAFLALPSSTLNEDLRLFRGTPLNSLELGGCRRVNDLTALKGMKLRRLSIFETAVTDLTPLEGMEVEDIRIPPPKTIARGLDMLRRMKSLQTIGISWQNELAWPAAVFWKKYDGGEFK